MRLYEIYRDLGKAAEWQSAYVESPKGTPGGARGTVPLVGQIRRSKKFDWGYVIGSWRRNLNIQHASALAFPIRETRKLTHCLAAMHSRLRLGGVR